jgi:hypothetical protein
MTDLGIPKRLILLCQMTLKETRSAVRIAKKASQPFPTTRGFRQGDALSCDLFNICLEIIVRRAAIQANNNILTKSVQLLGYADDIDIVSRDMRSMAESFNNIQAAAENMGLYINVDKTKYMKSSVSTPTSNNIKIADCEFEAVQDFTYLGSTVNATNDMSQEVKRRIMLANRTLFGLSRILRSRYVQRNTKIQIYKTLIIPVLIYGAETWTLSTSEKNLLGIFERKILRMIFGPVCDRGEWRIRYNNELYTMYSDSSIVEKIRKQQLRWLGHIQRMQEDRPPRRIAFARVEGRRRPGRQKLRWMEVLEKELAANNIRSWRLLAEDREKWRAVIDRL